VNEFIVILLHAYNFHWFNQHSIRMYMPAVLINKQKRKWTVAEVEVLSSNPWITGMGTIKWQTRAAHSCLIVGQSLRAQAWPVAYSLTPALPVTQKAPLQLWYAACGAI